MRFNEHGPGLLQVGGGVSVATFLRCHLQEAKVPKMLPVVADTSGGI